LADYPLPEEEQHLTLILFALALAPEPIKETVRKLLVDNGMPSRIVYSKRVARFDQHHFHHDVVSHTRTLFAEGYYFHSVFEVTRAYNKSVKEKTGRTEDGVKLTMVGCEGTLKIIRCERQTDKDVQYGLTHVSHPHILGTIIYFKHNMLRFPNIPSQHVA